MFEVLTDQCSLGCPWTWPLSLPDSPSCTGLAPTADKQQQQHQQQQTTKKIGSTWPISKSKKLVFGHWQFVETCIRGSHFKVSCYTSSYLRSKFYMDSRLTVKIKIHPTTYIYMYLSKYSGIEELLQLLVAVVDTELFETVHLEILWGTAERCVRQLRKFIIGIEIGILKLLWYAKDKVQLKGRRES